MNGLKSLGLGLVTTFLILGSGNLRAADESIQLPSTGELLGQVAALQESIAGLEDSGLLNHGRAVSLSKKLARVTNALTAGNPAGDASIQQASFLGEILTAVDALLDFVKELTHLVTDLPADVVQPIIDAAIDLLQDLLGLLLG